MPDQPAAETDLTDLAAGMRPILHPRSVAVVGAGRTPTSMSGRLFRNVLESFRGPVYPVNPTTSEICGVRTYPTILEVPGPVDLAFIVVPAGIVLDVVGQCLAQGVRGLVVITAGFAETGAAGQELQRNLYDMVRAAGVRMVGPNCLGVLNTDPTVQLRGTLAPVNLPAGNVGICTQSGALGVVIPDYLAQWRVGVSTFASIGNKADVSENDLLAWWRNDPATDVILLYLESFRDPAEFRRLVQEITRRKPIVVLKAASTAAGARAASSHTAALASPDRAAGALLRQTGALRVDTLQDFFEVSALLSSQPLPRGDRVAILTNAGGPGILCADSLAARGLLLPEASAELQADLRAVLRPEAVVRNPIDLIGSIDADEFRRCLERILRSREFDAVITIYVPREPGTSAGVARAVRETTQACVNGTTSLTVFMETDPVETGAILAELQSPTLRLPSFDYPEAAARALASARDYARTRARPAGRVPEFAGMCRDACRHIIDATLPGLDPSGRWLEPDEIQELLCTVGLRVPRWTIAHSADEAAAVAEDWNIPVVVKVIAPGVLHKTEIGGVVVNVTGRDAVRAAYQRATAAAVGARRVLIQEFIHGGDEAFIGVVRDPQFGHLMVLGCGGTLVELLDDVACRLHPLTDVDADEMLASVRTAAILTGYRGRPAADVAALKETLLRVSRLITFAPEIAELDLNPVVVFSAGNGVSVLDARIRIVPRAATFG